MPKSVSLEFEMFFKGQYFLVSYESESMVRNLLMRVQLGEYSLDTVDLAAEHKELYREIKNAMSNNAHSYWTTKETVNA